MSSYFIHISNIFRTIHTLHILLTYVHTSHVFSVCILYTHFKHISNNKYSAHTLDICTYFTCIQYFPGCINLAGTKLSAGSKIVRGQTFHTVVQVGHNARVLYTDQDIDGAEGEDMPYLCKLSPGERPLHTMHMIKWRYSQSWPCCRWSTCSTRKRRPVGYPVFFFHQTHESTGQTRVKWERGNVGRPGFHVRKYPRRCTKVQVRQICRNGWRSRSPNPNPGVELLCALELYIFYIYFIHT